MQHKLASGVIRVTYAGQTFEQVTTEDGIISYSINGQSVDKATWDQSQNTLVECSTATNTHVHSTQTAVCTSV